MAIRSAQIAIGATPVELTTAVSTSRYAGHSLVVRNRSATSGIYLGGPDVTTANGYQLSAGESITADLQSDDELYAVAAMSGTVHVLRTGV